MRSVHENEKYCFERPHTELINNDGSTLNAEVVYNLMTYLPGRKSKYVTFSVLLTVRELLAKSAVFMTINFSNCTYRECRSF